MKPLIYFLLFVIAIGAYSCSSTKQVIKTEDNVPIVESTSTPEVETPIHTTKTEDTQLEPESTIDTEIEIEETVIEDDVQTDYVTLNNVVDHSLWNELLQNHVSDQGNVNYQGFKTNRSKFYSYLELLSESPPQDVWNKDDTLAYWMNVYNAFTVKLILDNYPTKSIKDIDGPWNHRFIKIGKKWYTLNDVEHRIIRKMNEPRIHFALVCAAVSCPRLYNKAFTGKNLETDLELLTRGFLSDSSKNELTENTIKLSKIFKWYGGDFKTNGNSLIDFLNQYSDVTISSKAKKSYKDYNWDLNE